jgi:hypothetical protein
VTWCVLIELDSRWTAALDALNAAPEQTADEIDHIRAIAKSALTRDDPPPHIVAVIPKIMAQAFMEANVVLGLVRQRKERG